MPVPTVILAAAQNYKFNDKFVVDIVKGLTEEEWRRRPSETANDIAWIVGHVIWSRKMLLKRLGTDWSQPWLDLCARGSRVNAATELPSPDAMMADWKDVSAVLASVLDVASEEALAQPAVNGPPSADGKVSGIVNFLAIHETYHVGQAAYLKTWLGHKGPMG